MTEREKIEILQKKAEIPEVVRKKMQLAYGQIRQEKRMHEEIEGQKNERGKTVVSKKKVAIILAVATLSLATVSVAAGVYIRWSDGLKEKLQLTKAQEEELEETGAAESIGVSCTSQGITVTALQNITDQNFSQLAFSVKGYSVEMKEQPEFEQIIVKIDGKEVNVSGSFRNFGEEDEPVYQKADGTMEYLMQIDTNEKNGLATFHNHYQRAFGEIHIFQRICLFQHFLCDSHIFEVCINLFRKFHSEIIPRLFQRFGQM